jgi:YggT family protein
MQALLFILNTLLTLLVVAYLLRVLMPLVRADFRNPIGQAVLTITSPLVVPLRRIVPASKRRLDVAAVIALLIVQFVGTALLRLVAGATFSPLSIVIAGLYDLASTILQFYFVAILIYALLSWFASSGYNPAHQILARLCEPLLAPVRRVIPPLGGLDLSALFVLIALQALQILLR